MRPSDNHTSEHIGEVLREARLRKGLSLADVAEDLNIQTSYVESIETLNSDNLPPIGYVLGYVRAYAEYMGLPGQESVNQYKKDREVPQNLGMRDRPHFVRQRSIRLPRGFFAAATVMSCAAVVAFWYGSHSDTQAASLIDVQTSQPVFQATATVDETPSDLLTIKAVAPSWVEIKNEDGEVIVSRIFVPGETWQTSKDASITLSARDAGAFDVWLGEKSLGKVGEKGVAVFDINPALISASNPSE